MAALADELAYATAADVAARIARRELSPVEAVEACIARIEARNPSLNAVVYMGFDDARDAARAAERAVAAGEPLGPLHGVPTLLKDLYDHKPGWVSTFGGVRALRGFVANRHCGYAERMERAGAILVGKANSSVLGFRATCDNPLFGPTRNPFAPERNAGGSSGGGAAAVADGLVAVAEGSDAAGSIRVPAAWCGVVGLQPSPGRVPSLSRPNGFAGTSPFRYEGPIARTVADAALAMEALAGYHPADAFSLRESVDWRGAVDRGVEGRRIAFSPGLGGFPVDHRVAEVVAAAVTAFEEAGAHVEPLSPALPRDQRELSDLWWRMMMPGAHATLAGWRAAGIDVPAGDLPPELVRRLEESAGLDQAAITRDQMLRTELFDAVQSVFATHDLLVCPTACVLPVENGADGLTAGPAEIEGVAIDPLIGWCPTYITNFTGHPSVSLPAGFVDGLPVGLLVIGPRLGDADVLAASGAFERLRPWAGSYDRCARRPLTAAG